MKSDATLQRLGKSERKRQEERKGWGMSATCGLHGKWVLMMPSRSDPQRERKEGREMCEAAWRRRIMTCCLCPLVGTLGYNESSFHMEMSQIGFSTHTLDVSLVTVRVCVKCACLTCVSHPCPSPFSRMAFCLGWWAPMTGTVECWRKGPTDASCRPERLLKASFHWSSKIMLLI